MSKIQKIYQEKIKILYPNIIFDDLKVIGWGAGKEFSLHYPKLGIDLEYTICIEPANWGKLIHGTLVNKPEILENEDAGKILIIVFSAWWFDIFRQIKNLGQFKMIRAFSGWTEEYEKSYAISSKYSTIQKSKNENCVILMQGPLEAYTPMAIKLTKIYAPDLPIALSTWSNSELSLLEECQEYVDHLILTDLPEYTGPGGMNLIRQQKGVLQGLQSLKSKGYAHALKIRSDSSIYGNLYIDELVRLTEKEVTSTINSKGKIVFSGKNSWKYVPFHLTDQYQFGFIDDLIDYWSFDEDIEISTIGRDESYVYFSLATPESAIVRSYLSRNFFDKNKKYPNLSLEEYWGLLLKEFAMLPEPELSFCKWKSISLSSFFVLEKELDKNRLMDPIVIDWYKSLSDINIREEVFELMKKGYTIKDFAQNKIIE